VDYVKFAVFGDLPPILNNF